jgi:putative ABC transport system substrate-binding protein
MRWREFITLLGGAAAAWPFVARAQQATKHYRIGMLFPTSPTANAANLDAFRQRLQELGYVEGRNLVIDYRSAEGRPDRFPVLAAELVNLKADLIMTRGTPAALAAKSATRTIPVVMAAIGEAVETGVVASIAHPGGNITGLSSFIADVVSKRLELFIRNGSERPTDRPPFRIE